MPGEIRTQKRSALEMLRFAAKAMRLFGLMKRSNVGREKLCQANMEIAKLDPASAIRAQRVRELDEAMVQLYLGKWNATVAMKSGSSDTWGRAAAAFRS